MRQKYIILWLNTNKHMDDFMKNQLQKLIFAPL